MTIRYSLVDGEPRIVQVVGRPTIYLDQWMWVDLSRDAHLRKRFLSALTRTSGTVLYSVISLLELIRIQDEQQLNRIQEIMDAADYGFILADPAEVIRREGGKTSTA